MTDASLDIDFPLERTRARILKVNLAGERGACAIYRTQLAFGKFWPAETKAFLQHALDHEKGHARRFAEAMTERRVTPCRGTYLWIAGGYLLGLVSVLGGRRGVMACTAAIERAVHGHLEEQIAYLRERDDALADLIETIRIEEADHMRAGEEGYNPDCHTAGAFTVFVSAITEALIWLATFGDSARLRAALA